jgi:hypothetical protein
MLFLDEYCKNCIHLNKKKNVFICRLTGFRSADNIKTLFCKKEEYKYKDNDDWPEGTPWWIKY